MDSLQFQGDLGFSNGKYHVGLALVEFQEENVTIIYSPALDLSGYGYNREEARASFTEALNEFFRYTNNKNALDKVLKDLGWGVIGSKKRPKFTPPKDSDMVSLNPLYSDIVNTKNFSVSRENVEFAY
jgi:hypothetical protein